MGDGDCYYITGTHVCQPLFTFKPLHVGSFNSLLYFALAPVPLRTEEVSSDVVVCQQLLIGRHFTPQPRDLLHIRSWILAADDIYVLMDACPSDVLQQVPLRSFNVVPQDNEIAGIDPLFLE